MQPILIVMKILLIAWIYFTGKTLFPLILNFNKSTYTMKFFTVLLLVHKKVISLFQDELYINANHASI